MILEDFEDRPSPESRSTHSLFPLDIHNNIFEHYESKVIFINLSMILPILNIKYWFSNPMHWVLEFECVQHSHNLVPSFSI